MPFFKKKQAPTIESKPSASRISFEQLTTASDEYLNQVGLRIINGEPLVLNFDLLNTDDSNKAIAFVSGVAFGVDGAYRKLNEKSYLFANSEAFKDGTLNNWLINYLQQN
jgi:FtsZ-interacting cell division protein YlmF